MIASQDMRLASSAAEGRRGSIELRGIGKTFPGVRALHDVSLEIRAGEVLGLVGENGAGKSTLMKILGGAYATGSFTGELAIDGQLRAFRSTRDARRAGIAVVHQELCLVPELSVADNLVLGREPARFGIVDDARVHAIARDMLARVLGDAARAIDIGAPVGELGIAVQQLVEIARALADDARVVILDEPTAALADAEVIQLMSVVRARRAAGTAFVYITHRLEEIAQLCDRVAVLRDGELVDIVAPSTDLVPLMTGSSSLIPSPSPSPSSSPLLSISHLSISHPRLPSRRVVDDLSFVVHAGEILALAGAMGSGRTATLSALFGAARSRVTGSLTIASRSLSLPRTPRDAIAAGIALVPEDRKAHGLVLDLSVGANLALSSDLPFLIDDARIERAARSRLRDLSIKAPGLGVEVATLSGGNQQKVVIAKWLERAPRVLLLDEPTRGVDVGAKAEIYRIVEDLAARGHAIVIASSDLPEIVRLADRVLVLRDGRLAGALTDDAIAPLAIMQLAVGHQEAA
jgi:ABC-type sugar transport system ATPase subunit